ncbi:type II secretion system protein N [Hylemonella gracilis]|nr:type II secretion system protein N [Hylemonella gracilis]
MHSVSIVSKRKAFSARPAHGPAVAAWSIWRARLLTLLVWGGVGWSATYWVLSASPSAPRMEIDGQVAATEDAFSDAQAVARALGSPSTVTVSDVTTARYKLLGVAAGAQGVALIAIDDQPGRPYRLNATLPDGARIVALGRDSASVRLNDGQTMILRVSELMSGASAAAASVPPVMTGSEQAQLPVEALAEPQGGRERNSDDGSVRLKRGKEAANSAADVILERRD